MGQANGLKVLLSFLMVCTTGTALAENDDKTQLEVIEITMPKPTATLDLSSREAETERPQRHCLKNTGTRLRTRGTGRCAVGSGHAIRNEMQHRGWASLSAGARLKDSSGY